MESTNPNVIEISIPDGIIGYLQMLDFEISGLKVLHTHALTVGVSEEKCNKIKEDFLEKYKELGLAKQEIEQEFLSDINFTGWNINYPRGIMYVYTN